MQCLWECVVVIHVHTYVYVCNVVCNDMRTIQKIIHTLTQSLYMYVSDFKIIKNIIYNTYITQKEKL